VSEIHSPQIPLANRGGNRSSDEDGGLQSHGSENVLHIGNITVNKSGNMRSNDSDSSSKHLIYPKISFALIGAQKSGTTAFYGAVRSVLKEFNCSNYFLPIFENHIFDFGPKQFKLEYSIENIASSLNEEELLEFHADFFLKNDKEFDEELWKSFMDKVQIMNDLETSTGISRENFSKNLRYAIQNRVKRYKGMINIRDKRVIFDDVKLSPQSIVLARNPALLMQADKSVPLLRRLGNPDIKFIVLLRDPISRLKSQYNHNVRKKKKNPYYSNLHVSDNIEKAIKQDVKILHKLGIISKFENETKIFLSRSRTIPGEQSIRNEHEMEQSIEKEQEMAIWSEYEEVFRKNIDIQKGAQGYVGRGMYDLQLKSWFKYYPREKFLCIAYEDLLNETKKGDIAAKVLKFLDIPQKDLLNDMTQRLTAKLLPKFRVKTPYQKARHIGMGRYDRRGPRKQLEMAHNIILDQDKRHYKSVETELSKNMTDFLKSLYSVHNAELENLLGKEWKGIWN